MIDHNEINHNHNQVKILIVQYFKLKLENQNNCKLIAAVILSKSMKKN